MNSRLPKDRDLLILQHYALFPCIPCSIPFPHQAILIPGFKVGYGLKHLYLHEDVPPSPGRELYELQHKSFIGPPRRPKSGVSSVAATAKSIRFDTLALD